MNNLITQEEKNKIDALCKQYRIRNYTINSDGSIDVAGDVLLNGLDLKKIPLNFNKVHADFNCYHNYLTSLEGCPVEVGGDFKCAENNLTSLEHCPKEVGGNFNCNFNSLTSLKGCPTTIGGDFDCYRNKLSSFEYCPTDIQGGNFDFDENPLPNQFREEYGFLFGIINHNDDDEDDEDVSIERLTDEQQIFLKYQSYFNVWTPGFNMEGMKDLIAEIKDGLR
jgi:hypothetical protein